MTDTLSGGCKCGLVRYCGDRADAPMFRCHCRDCQHLTGAGHSEMVPLIAATFVIGTDCKTYQMQGGSGQPTYSSFCPECGSPLMRRSTRMSDRVYVHAASLDDPCLYVPARSIYCDAAQPWDDGIITT